MEIADVAKALALRVPTAKSRIHRALARLRPELEVE
jgi:DNA-directed RNA polymerase specialized sigma24 family protein